MAVTERDLNRESAHDSVDRKVRRWPRRTIGSIAVLGVALLATGGSHLMFRNNNMDDFEALRKFTSPAGQEDRCNMEKALDAQEQMRQHFDAQGGVPEEQVPAVSDFVGLEDDQATYMMNAVLFQMPMDCQQPTASSNEATQGIVMVTAAAGIAIGATGSALLRRRGR